MSPPKEMHQCASEMILIVYQSPCLGLGQSGELQGVLEGLCDGVGI